MTLWKWCKKYMEDSICFAVFYNLTKIKMMSRLSKSQIFMCTHYKNILTPTILTHPVCNHKEWILPFTFLMNREKTTKNDISIHPCTIRQLTFNWQNMLKILQFWWFFQFQFQLKKRNSFTLSSFKRKEILLRFC